MVEDKIILSRIPSQLQTDKSVLSKNVSITNFFKYDLIIISFVPSFGTPHFKLIELLLKLNKFVISINTDQNNLYFDYYSRSKSYEILCKLGLKLFILDKNFNHFILKLNLLQGKLKINNFNFINHKQGEDAKISDNLVFVFDFKWSTASDNYYNYKKRVGYDDAVLKSAFKYSTSYTEYLASLEEEIVENFQFKKIYIYVDSLVTPDEIKKRFDGRLIKNAEIIDGQKLIELIEENSIIVTNWHCIELIKHRENIKIFRLKFNYQEDFDFTKKIQPAHNFEEKNLSKLTFKFEVFPIKSNPAVIDISGVHPISNKFKSIRYDNPWTYTSLIFYVVSFIVHSINLLLVQLRFFPYNLKNIIKNLPAIN